MVETLFYFSTGFCLTADAKVWCGQPDSCMIIVYFQLYSYVNVCKL